MSNFLKPFISDKLPQFIQDENPQFKLFIEAYYEWLEKQNTKEASTVKELFKELRNPAGIINNSHLNRDIDNTLDGYLRYFREEIIPISVETAQATERFTLKKIRDLYLAKGTPKSYKLLFRLIWNNEIELFKSFDDVIDTSEGSYISFPTCHFKVVDYVDRLEDVELQLSYITDSEDLKNVVTTNLSGIVVGKSGLSQIIRSQLSAQADMKVETDYYLVDGSDSTKYVKVRLLPTINEITFNNGGSFYKEEDILKFYSKHFDRYWDAEVEVSERSPITHITVRNRGQFYREGDMFNFYSDDVYDGKGGYFTVTGVDASGRITEIDGINLRGGVLNNGFRASTFDDVKIPILNGGEWKVLPKIRYNPNGTAERGEPYNNLKQGYGFQCFPIAENLGVAKDIKFKDVPYFDSDGDISIEVPKNLIVDQIDGLEVGQVLSFQQFRPSNGSFTEDSEQLEFKISNYRQVSEDWDKYHSEKFALPIGYDSEFYQWKNKLYVTDSDRGLNDLFVQLDSDSKLYFGVVYDSDKVYDGLTWSSTGSVTADGPTSFGGAGNDLDLGDWKNIPGSHITVNYNGNSIVNELDEFHHSQIDFKGTYTDSEMTFNYNVIRSNPSKGVDSDLGSFDSTLYFAKIVDINGNIVKVVPEPNRQFPEDSDLDKLSSRKYGVIRLQPIDGSGVAEGETDLSLKNILMDYSSFDVEWNTAVVVDSAKFFINEDGFLNSPAGGVLQDGFRYSKHAYIVKTTIAMEEWREKVKKLLHPAGKIMFGEIVIDMPVDASPGLPKSTDTGRSVIATTRFSFSAAQDHWTDTPPAAITADNQLYKVNSFESNGKALNADTYTNLAKYNELSQHGNAFWDLEPIGLTHKEQIDYSSFGTYLNFNNNDQWNKTTTQDSDGNGYVQSGVSRWSQYNGTVQDLYKNESRRDPFDNQPVYLRTFFRDSITERYTTYDSEVPTHVFMRMGDSDYVFRGIDYNKLKSNNDTRNWPYKTVPRQVEYEIAKNKDYSEANKESGLFSFTIGNTTWKDEEAYEMKWNTYNSARTIGDGGWEIIGFQSYIQNISNNKKRIRRMSNYGFEEIKYSKIKTPLNYTIWDQESSDIWTWNPTYGKEINSITSFDYDLIKQPENNKKFDQDPSKWSGNRRDK